MIKTLIYPTLTMDVLRLEMTEEQLERFENLSNEEKVQFIVKNLTEEEKEHTYPDLISDIYSAGNVHHLTLQRGICQNCGCTENDACYHPEHGSCWWADENQNLCSHCADLDIACDPQTIRPSGVKKAVF